MEIVIPVYMKVFSFFSKKNGSNKVIYTKIFLEDVKCKIKMEIINLSIVLKTPVY